MKTCMVLRARYGVVFALATMSVTHVAGQDYDCSVCSDITSAQAEALAMYDNGGKIIVCDPTCLDGVSDSTHCNYFGLGQVCRGCGDCTTCTPCPDESSNVDGTGETSTDVEVGTSGDAGITDDVDTSADVTADASATADTSEDDCSVCSDLTSAQEEALAMYDNGGKTIVCDPTCLDGISDSTHCNYFGLGQICRGCGDCETCTPCPDATSDGSTSASAGTETDSQGTSSASASVSASADEGLGTDTDASAAASGSASGSASADEGADAESSVSASSGADTISSASGEGSNSTSEYDCSVCSDITSAQEEALAMYDNGGKTIVCDPTCLDGVSDSTHCNYFGLGQICRGCGDCSSCTPCP